MNRLHRWYCKSGHWKRAVEGQILPWALDGIDLGESVLEVGPGPGVTTDCCGIAPNMSSAWKSIMPLLLPSNADSQPRT